MRAFQVVAILVASLTVSADVKSASVKYNDGCSLKCTGTRVADVTDCFKAIADEKCKQATVTVNYNLAAGKDCKVTAPAFDLGLAMDVVDKDLAKMGSKTAAVLQQLDLTFANAVTDCKNKLSLNTQARADSCQAAKRTALEAKIEVNSKTVTVTKQTKDLAIDTSKLDLLLASTNCPAGANVEGSMIMQVDYALSTLKDVSIKFDDCQPTECADLTDIGSVKACLTAASGDDKCKAGTFTRTINIATPPCDDKASKPLKFQMDLASVLAGNDLIASSDKKTTLTRVAFPVSGDKDKCTATLADSTSCTDTGKPSPLQATDPSALVFTGSAALPAGKPILIAEYKNKGTAGACTATAKATPVGSVTAVTKFTFSGGHAPSGALNRVAISTLVIFAAFLATAF